MKDEMVKTAGMRLEAIEAWSRRTFLATMAGTIFLGLIASGLAVVGWEYLRLKRAIGEAATQVDKTIGEFTNRQLPAKPWY
jgi:hypothetical protein